ncbi:hypothetical protein B9479_003116 [Cryptococcus floricola]|uniref:Uncharacterized protein n=1 Tax=Cryptococcus floricola TaxID=2591691 RepID=A0A5D3B1D9_9TREE|nr:hypothetical protein B9479_003116 [Cryptococcus floricola]
MKNWIDCEWFQVCTPLILWLQAFSFMLWSERAPSSAGGGIVSTTLITSLIACVEPAENSLAISACYLSRAISQAIGVAISSAIQQSILISSPSSRFPSNPDVITKLIQEPAEIMPLLGGEEAWEARLAYLDVIRGGVWVFDGRRHRVSGGLYHDQREEALIDCVLGLLGYSD